LLKALDTGKPDTLTLQRYDVPAPDQTRQFEERW
jgi:hypothetical protein